MTDVYTVPIKNFEDVQKNHALGHKIAMSLFPDRLNHDSPRSSASILWCLDEDNQSMVVSSSIPPENTNRVSETHSIPQLSAGDAVDFDIIVSLTYTPVAHVPDELWAEGYRPKTGRKVAVPDDEVNHRFANKMLDRGANIENIDSVKKKTISVKRGNSRNINHPVFHIKGSLTVTDKDKFNDCLRDGVGNLKNYGAGMLRVAS